MSFRCLYKWILILLLGSYRARIVHCTSGSGDSPATSTDQTALFSLGSGSTSQDTPSSPPSQSTNLTGSTNATTNDSGASVQAHSSDDEPGLPPALKALAAKCEIITQTGVTFETHKGEDCATSEDDKTLKFDLPGINCVEFKYDGKTLWNHDSDTRSDYPESIKFTSKTVEICYSDSSIKYPLTSEESSTTTETPAEKSEPLSVPSTESPTKIPEALPAPSTETLTDKSENQTSETLPPVTFTVVTAETAYGKNPSVNDVTKYDIEEENNILKYKFKHGAYCVELKAGDCSIWTHSLSKEGIEFPKSIFVNRDSFDVMVKFENFLTYFYKHKMVDDKSTWVLHQVKDLDKFYVSKLKLLTEDDGDGTNAKDLHKTLYETTCDSDLCYFELKDGSNCSRIDYDGEPVWRHAYSDYGFPKSLFLDVTLKLLLMEFEEVTCTYSLLEDGSPFVTPKHDPKVELPLSVDNLQLFTVDPNDASVLRINEKTMYDLKTVGNTNPVSRFYFKPESKCEMVMFRYKEIWEYDEKKHEKRYPIAVYLTPVNSMIIVWFGDEWFYAYKRSTHGWRLELESTEGKAKILGLEDCMEPVDSLKQGDYMSSQSLPIYQEFDPNLLKLMVTDDEHGSGLRENDKTMYNVRTYKNGRTFKFKRGMFCHKVMFGRQNVWEYNETLHRGHFPTHVDFDTEEPEMIRVVLANDWFYVYEFEDKAFALTETYEPAVPLMARKKPVLTGIIKFLSAKFSRTPVAPLAFPEESDEESHESVISALASSETGEDKSEHQDESSQPEARTSEPTSVSISLPDALKISTSHDDHPNDHRENDFSMFDLFKYGPVFECAFKPGVKCDAVKYDGQDIWTRDPEQFGCYSPTALYFDEAKTPMFRVFFKNDWNYTYKFNGSKWMLKYSRTDGQPFISHPAPGISVPSARYPHYEDPTEKYEHLGPQIRKFIEDGRPVPLTPELKDKILIPFKKHPPEINVFTLQNGNAVLNIDDETLYEVKRGTSGGNVLKYGFKPAVKCVKLMYGHTKVWEHDPKEHGNFYPISLYYVRNIKMVTVVFSDKWFYTYQLINHKFELAESVKPEAQLSLTVAEAETSPTSSE